jgi:Cupin superfamily protein
MSSGTGLVIRHAEKLDAGVAGLAASVTQHIPGEVHVQLIVTPAGTYGFGWHYDDEDVFIVQTEGSKHYFFRDNTAERERPSGTAPDFTRFGGEAAPIGTARLLAGDWLYIPTLVACGKNASRIHFRFPSAFFPTRPGLPVSESSDRGETVVCGHHCCFRTATPAALYDWIRCLGPDENRIVT